MELDLLENLLKAETSEDLLSSAQQAVAKLGFERFILALRIPEEEGGTRDFIFGTYPGAWMERYTEQRYEFVDPTVAHCLTRSTPIVWTHQLFATPGVDELHDESIQSGISGGACFPIYNPRLGGVGLVSIANDDDTDRAVPQVLDVMAKGQLFACYLNEAVDKLMQREETPLFTLSHFTPRERECLAFAAQGLSSAQIADRLNTSDRTVIFHLQNACEKLGARNRQEAVARAIVYGIVRP